MQHLTKIFLFHAQKLVLSRHDFSVSPPLMSMNGFVNDSLIQVSQVELYIKERARGRRVEVSRGGTSERFVAKTFTVPVRPKVKVFFATPRLQGDAKEAKLVPLCTKKGRQQKNIKRNRARGARFHLSHLYVFQGYMHFLQTLHSWGLKFDYQIG